MLLRQQQARAAACTASIRNMHAHAVSKVTESKQQHNIDPSMSSSSSSSSTTNSTVYEHEKVHDNWNCALPRKSPCETAGAGAGARAGAAAVHPHPTTVIPQTEALPMEQLTDSVRRAADIAQRTGFSFTRIHNPAVSLSGPSTASISEVSAFLPSASTCMTSTTSVAMMPFEGVKTNVITSRSHGALGTNNQRHFTTSPRAHGWKDSITNTISDATAKTKETAEIVVQKSKDGLDAGMRKFGVFEEMEEIENEDGVKVKVPKIKTDEEKLLFDWIREIWLDAHTGFFRRSYRLIKFLVKHSVLNLIRVAVEAVEYVGNSIIRLLQWIVHIVPTLPKRLVVSLSNLLVRIATFPVRRYSAYVAQRQKEQELRAKPAFQMKRKHQMNVLTKRYADTRFPSRDNWGVVALLGIAATMVSAFIDDISWESEMLGLTADEFSNMTLLARTGLPLAPGEDEILLDAQRILRHTWRMAERNGYFCDFSNILANSSALSFVGDLFHRTMYREFALDTVESALNVEAVRANVVKGNPYLPRQLATLLTYNATKDYAVNVLRTMRILAKLVDTDDAETLNLVATAFLPEQLRAMFGVTGYAHNRLMEQHQAGKCVEESWDYATLVDTVYVLSELSRDPEFVARLYVTPGAVDFVKFMADDKGLQAVCPEANVHARSCLSNIYGTLQSPDNIPERFISRDAQKQLYDELKQSGVQEPRAKSSQISLGDLGTYAVGGALAFVWGAAFAYRRIAKELQPHCKAELPRNQLMLRAGVLTAVGGVVGAFATKNVVANRNITMPFPEDNTVGFYAGAIARLLCRGVPLAAITYAAPHSLLPGFCMCVATLLERESTTPYTMFFSDASLHDVNPRGPQNESSAPSIVLVSNDSTQAELSHA
jgi:hypothetical protein